LCPLYCSTSTSSKAKWYLILWLNNFFRYREKILQVIPFMSLSLLRRRTWSKVWEIQLLYWKDLSFTCKLNSWQRIFSNIWILLILEKLNREANIIKYSFTLQGEFINLFISQITWLHVKVIFRLCYLFIEHQNLDIVLVNKVIYIFIFRASSRVYPTCTLTLLDTWYRGWIAKVNTLKHEGLQIISHLVSNGMIIWKRFSSANCGSYNYISLIWILG